ncbi:MAG: hypothetical protein HY585_00615 [Candidatus Omnitrophica bacterium]|nr:hypothetical protein [Candidatus Omnitrophota bacterium]
MIGFLGWILIALGTATAFGAYEIVRINQLNTLAVIVLPLMYLAAGVGLLRFKGWTRYLVAALASFHVLLGILSLKEIVTFADFFPIVPIIEWIPSSVLRQNPFSSLTMLIISHFVIPFLIVSYLSLKHVAVQFESWLQGNFSWGAPCLVVLASGFIFSFTLLNSSEVGRFFSPQSRVFFGFTLTPVQGVVSHHVEFYLLLLLSFGLISGGRAMWILTVIFALNYWFPFASGKTYLSTSSFEFLFFGIGWILTVLVLLIHWKFFWLQTAWLESRKP